MSMGGSQTTTQSIPGWVEAPAKRNLARAEEISQIGYVPYGGPDVAAFSDAQNAAFANNRSMADAYGMQSGGNYMPQSQTFAGGVQGYSSLPLYEESVAQLAATRPGQYNAINAQFIDPTSGAIPTGTAATTAAQGQARTPDYGGPADHGYGGPDRSGGSSLGGYSGIGDMFDGGGPGASGGAFQGGGRMSDVANGITGRGPEGGGNGGGVK